MASTKQLCQRCLTDLILIVPIIFLNRGDNILVPSAAGSAKIKRAVPSKNLRRFALNCPNRWNAVESVLETCGSPPEPARKLHLTGWLGGTHNTGKMNRLITLLILCGLLLPAAPFEQRGYYMIFSRVPTYGLPEWKTIVDSMQEDKANFLILWIAGGFRSKKFPITWQYNADHKNVKADFARELIDYAHGKGIKVVLGFSPFSYDGVNQYTLEHPELKATQKDGKFSALWGMHSWGYSLTPSRPESQQFMLEYIREMYFDFYPNADGLMIESSDYSVDYSEKDPSKYYENEFKFVRKISDEVWARNSHATILVYPHYFSGKKVQLFDGIVGGKMPFDPRWTLFFTPHSAPITPELLKSAPHSIWWDMVAVKGTPSQIRESARKARAAGVNSFVPTLESYSFQVKYPEGGEAYMIGRREKPFGFEWLKDGDNPYTSLLIRVNRIAYREFSQNPDLDFEDFKRVLGHELFGNASDPEKVNDLLFLQESVVIDRSWNTGSPLLAPWILKGKLECGFISRKQLMDYNRRLDRIGEIANRFRTRNDAASKQVSYIASWITNQWQGDSRKLIADHLR